MRHRVEPINDLAFRIEDCDVNVTLSPSRWPWTTPMIEFLGPNGFDRCRNLGVVSMTVPGSDDKWAKLLNDRRVD